MTTPSRKHLKADFFWPLVALAVFAMALVVGMAFVMIDQFDHSARDREQAVVQNGLAERMGEIGRLAASQVEWDEAVRRLDNRFDPDWARENIGLYLFKVDGFDQSYVLGPDDRPLFASDQGRSVPVGRFEAVSGDSRPILASVRQAEAARNGRIAQHPPLSGYGAPLQAGALAVNQGRLYVVSAALVQPDLGASLPRGARAPILVTLYPVNRAFLDRFGQRFLLKGLTAKVGPAPADRDRANIALKDERGRTIATLAWTPVNPGRALIQRLVTPILLVVIALTALALMLYRRSMGQAQNMIASEARAAHLAYYDALTGLPNRVLFHDRLGQALGQMRRQGPRVAVHCIDLDRLKEVNDSFGHHVGDALIQEAARRMAGQCRASDTLARLSGDEFAIVQSGATAASAAALAERLTKIMTQPIALGSVRVFGGCSIGVSLIADAEIDPAEALRQADLALYRAKQTARGQYCFYETEMDAATKARRVMESDLRDALARGEVRLAYQPQVNRQGALIGVEALARWRHPDRGDIAPAYFVSIAEECGLIVDLGMFALRRAFEDSRRWDHLKVSVNVSANQLRMKDFTQRVGELVDELHVDPRRFELEVSETLLLGDDPEVQDRLSQLRHMGFGLALDDFGAGYSSLNYLKRFPISRIKIDRSFVATLGVDAGAVAVVGAIIDLAAALHLPVIAEGVETAEQYERLVEAGCCEFQGYLFSQPTDIAEIDRLHQARRQALAPRAV